MIRDEVASDLPAVGASKLVDMLSEAYVSLIRSGQPFSMMPSVMLWGQPGIGKSQAVRQIAQRVASQSGRKAHITDVRLILFNPIDLRGIPSADAKKEFSVWLKPEIFKMDEGSKHFNVLLLDEITAALPSVQAAAYQLALDRSIGEHKLPDNCVVIAAGNRVTDKSVAYKMPKALSNRLMHFEVKSDFDEWKRWALQAGIDSRVIGFLSFRHDLLNTFDSADDSVAFATPRTWEMVSNILSREYASDFDCHALVCGLVGNANAHEFRAFMDDCASIPDIDDVFGGRECEVPTKVSSLYALCSAMVAEAAKRMSDMRQIDNSLSYAARLPRDFGIMLVSDYQSLGDGFDRKLMKSQSFMRLLNKNSAILNGLRKK